MILEKLDKYIGYIDFLESEVELPIDEVMEKYVNSSSEDRIKMLFEMNGKTRERIKALIDGGII